MKRTVKTVFLTTIGLGALAVAMPAAAQEAPADGASEEGQITVTARKREENLIDVPLPVTVATAEQLNRDQVYNLNDLQRITPALEVSQTAGGETNGGARLRGLGTGVFNPSVQSSVALVIDQMPVGNLSFPQLFDLAQVEVLRGPQGTLFGQGSSAGVLNISTRKPSTSGVSVNGSIDFADKGSAGAEVGELVVNGGFNLPFGDSFAIRVASQYKRETGLQRSVTTGKDNVIEDFGVRVRALMKPSDTFTVNISGEYGENTSNGQTFFALAIAPNVTSIFDPPGPPPPGVLAVLSTNAFLGCGMTVISPRAEQYCEAIPSYTTLKVTSLGMVVDWEASDTLSITSVSSYRERRFTQLSRDFTRLSSAASARQERNVEYSRSFSQELRANVDLDSVNLTIGGYYSDFRFKREPIGTFPFTFGSNLQGQRIGFGVCPASGLGFCPVATSFTDEETENRTFAAFADATFKLSEQFEIFGGIRVTDYRNVTSIQVFRVTPDVLRTFTTDESNFSGRIGASFRPSPDVNIYASYARGYKPTAVGARAIGTLFQLAPELSDAFELGAKFKLGRFQLSANVFHTQVENFQSQQSVFVGTQLVSEPYNVPGKVKSQGFELTAFGEVLPGLTINAGYQYNDIKYPAGVFGDDAVDTNADGVFDNNVIPGLPFVLGGTQFLNAPKHKFTLSGEYAVPVGQSVELFLNANLIYKSEVLLAARANPAYRYPAHELVNLGFGIRDQDGAWTLSVFVRNLTKERAPMAYLGSTFGGAIDGGLRAWPIAGQTARVVGVRFGFEF